MRKTLSIKSCLVAVLLEMVPFSSVQAQTFTPIALTPGSFTQSIVVPADWPYRYNAQSVTVTLGAGPSLQTDTVPGSPTYYSVESGETLFEQGLEGADPTYGVPPGGSTFSNATLRAASNKHVYTVPYWTNYASNCLFIGDYTASDTYNGLSLSGGPYVAQTYTSGSLTLLNEPNSNLLNSNNFTALSFLVTAANGTAVTSVRISYADGSAQSVPILGIPGFSGTGATNTATGGGPSATLAWACNARFNPAENENAFDNTASQLFAVDIGLSDTTSPATNVSFTYTSGGNGAVFAVSGGTNPGDQPANTGPLTGPFAPIPVNGFNAGCVVANAAFTTAGLAPLTDSMEDLTDLAPDVVTWIEQGYDLAAPTNGFPPHGSTITSSAYTNRTYQMPSSYQRPMSVLIDSGHRLANVTPANTNIAYTAFSLLAAGGNIISGNAMTNYIILQHGDGINESNLFLGFDWYDPGVPYAWNANERIYLTAGNGRYVDHLDDGFPRLFESEFQTYDGSPVTNIVLGFLLEPQGSASTYVFAVSATTNLIPVQLGSYTAAQNVYAGDSAVFSANPAFGTLPIYQWQIVKGGATNNLADGSTGTGSTLFGSTTSNLTVSNVSSADEGYYTCFIQNSVPSATNSPAAPLTLLVSTNMLITRPGDPITDFYNAIGTADPYPATGLGAGKILDGTLTPYLNYGGNGPGNVFAGPVGFVVTPSIGNSIVTAARIYTSTNSPASDPADFTLYGSIDGLNWTNIVSTSLTLPLARNLSSGTINSNNQVLEEIDFANNTQAYLAYAAYFTNVVGMSAASNGLEFAEVQLLGTSTQLPDLVWFGGVSSAWDTTTLNWNSGSLAYTDPDQVRFDDTASSAIVTLAATVSPGSILVTNNVLNYVFNSSGGQIVGYGALIKEGTASLRISDSGADNFAGGIIAGQGSLVLNQAGALSGGILIGSGATVQVGNSDASGSLPAGSVTNNGSLIFNRTGNFTNSGAISGPGSVANDGAGTNTFTHANTFSGGLTINNGTVQVASTGSGGTPLGGAPNNSSVTAAANVTVNSGATLVGLGEDAFGYYANTVPATIFINGGTITDVGTSSYRITLPNLAFTGGALTTIAGNNGDVDGNFSLYGAAGKCTVASAAADSTAAISGGIVGIQSSLTFQIAAGTTPSGIDLLVTSVMGNYGVNPIAKTGLGVMEWTGVNTFTGGIFIGSGALVIGGSGQLGGGNYASPITNDAIFTFNSSAAQVLSGTISGSGTLEQNGSGTLTLTGGVSADGLSIGGGTLIIGGSGKLNAGSYGGGITNNAVFTYNSSAAQILSGVVSGTGALNQYGAGKLTLSAANTYTGKTTISNGVLTLASSGSLASALIAVTNGATFDVSGFGSGFTLAAGQTLGGNGAVSGSVVATSSSILNAALYGGSTLRFSNNLTLNGNAANGVSNLFDLSTTTTGANSLVAITGLLALHGTNTIKISYATLAPGSYHLITYGSESLGANAQWNLAGFTTTGGQTASIVDTGTGQINLMVTGLAGSLTWVGDGSANDWDTNTFNWSNQVTMLPEKFNNGETVTFNDAGSETPLFPVQLIGVLSPGAILVSNTGNYVFSGTGSLSGETGLTKFGSGTLGLLETGGDNFSGGILVGGGSLILSNTSVNISGGLMVTNGELTVAHSGTISGGLSMSNVAGGTPSVLIIGSGTLNGGIAAAGSLIISNSPVIAGALLVNGGSTLLDQTTTPSGSTTIASGATLQVGNNDANGNLPSGSVIDNGSLVFNQSAYVTVANVISGSGAISQVGSNTLTLGGGNSAYTGHIAVTNGILKATVKAALGASAANIVVTNNGTLDLNGIAFNSSQPALTVSGAGYTGAGALVNSGAAQLDAFSNITVSANVILGGAGRWDLRASSGTEASLNVNPAGSPYTITKTGTNKISLVNVGTIDAGLGDIDVQQGQLSIQFGTVSPGNPASNLIVGAGATLGMYELSNALNKVITLNGSGTNHTFFAEAGSASENIIAGPVTLNGDCWFDVTNGVFATFGGDISGGGNLIKINPGTLTLTNVNTYTGATTISNGTLTLGSGASISNTAGVTIASGGTLDVSALGAAATFTMPGTSFAASGNPTAAIVGGASGTVSFSSLPITLTYNGSDPALILSQGTLLFNSNVFTVNTSNGSPLSAGSYVLMNQANGNISGFVSSAVTGTALPVSGTTNFVTISAGNLVLEILKSAPITVMLNRSGDQLSFSWPADHLGWTLQTNSGDISKSGDWFPYAGSTMTTSETITINQSQPSVFFRLVDY